MGALFFLLLAALAYQVLALFSLARFFKKVPFHQVAGDSPGITVFKPVRGLDPETRECLESFLTQDYHPYQVLFGVADPSDPVLPLLETFRQAAPSGQVEVKLCPETLGHNPKVSILRQLEPLARYDLLVVADGDVKVGSDFLGRVAAAFQERQVGLVSCPYRAGPLKSLGSQLEALTISGEFIPSVVVARYVEGISFALGAAMAFTRTALAHAGGFVALADYLADDYQLGWRIYQAGFKVKLLPYVVETVNPSISIRDYWAHQQRWTRTYRVCRPRGYLAYGLTHALVFSLLLWLISGLTPWALGLVAATLALRLIVAWFSEKGCLGGHRSPSAFLLLPLKDLAYFGLWLSSFWGNEVVWQGRRYNLTREGLLVPFTE